MKLAFYYHVSMAEKTAKLYLPSYLGVFIDENKLGVEFVGRTVLPLLFGYTGQSDLGECRVRPVRNLEP